MEQPVAQTCCWLHVQGRKTFTARPTSGCEMMPLMLATSSQLPNHRSGRTTLDIASEGRYSFRTSITRTETKRSSSSPRNGESGDLLKLFELRPPQQRC